MTWVYNLPLPVAGFIFIAGFCLLSAAGLLVVRRLYPRADEITHNDVAGPIMTTIGTVLAVLLTFMVVTVWQEHDAAAQTASVEAGNLADVYHESFALPNATGAPLRRDILRYLALVVNDEWKLMRRGAMSLAANNTAHRIVNRVARFDVKTMSLQIAAADALRHAHGFLDARRSRLFNNQQSVPKLVWMMMLLVAAVTIASCYFFRVSNLSAHLLMTVALGIVVGATFLMIAELDLPFRGPLQIRPDAFTAQQYRLPRTNDRF